MRFRYITPQQCDRSRSFAAYVKVRRFLPHRLRDSIRYRIFDNSFIGSTAHFGGGGTVEFCGKVTINEGVRFGIEGGLVRIGAAVTINEYALFWQVDGGSLNIANDVYIGPHCVIDSTGGLTIGTKTLIGPGVQIHSSDHGTAQDRPYQDQPYTRRAVTIGANVWIGGNVVVTKGVTIGEGAIVGAGAVVTNDVPPRHLALGIPARSKPLVA